MDKKEAEMISKSLQDINQMLFFMEEFTGMCHQMILHLYMKTGYPIPDHFTNYKFRNKNPWSNKHE